MVVLDVLPSWRKSAMCHTAFEIATAWLLASPEPKEVDTRAFNRYAARLTPEEDYYVSYMRSLKEKNSVLRDSEMKKLKNRERRNNVH